MHIYIQVVDTPALSKKEGESNNLFCEAPLKLFSQDGLASYSVRAQRFRLDGRNTRWLALPESAQRLNINIHWKSLSMENFSRRKFSITRPRPSQDHFLCQRC